jgi:hypothetical protein
LIESIGEDGKMEEMVLSREGTVYWIPFFNGMGLKSPSIPFFKGGDW